MSVTTYPIDVEPIDSAPMDGRAFEAVMEQRAVLVRKLLGRWQWKVETFDTRANQPKLAWQYMPEGVEPKHWVKGSVGRHGSRTSKADDRSAT